MIRPFRSILTLQLCLVLMSLLFPNPSSGGQAALPSRLIVGYWHNFSNGSVLIPLAEVPAEYDVINVAFALPTTYLGATITFVPDPNLYPDPQGFIDEVWLLKTQGKKVLISLGGANSAVQLKTPADIQSFVTSMTSIINVYGFDGIDIDLESQSLSLQAGDNDFRSPTTPVIVNMIAALKLVLAQFPGGLMLSAAPETACVQGGAATYAGVFGSYLPLIHALREQFTYVHVQHYNTGTMFGRDGVIYQPPTADFHVAMADMLLGGFNVKSEAGPIFFSPLPPEKVVIGLPAAPEAASTGFTTDSVIHIALDYLYMGRSFGGKYHIADPQGYPKFRGLMTWSINWDLYRKQVWSKAQRKYLDNIVLSAGGEEAAGQEVPEGQPRLEQNYPNPFNPTTVIRYSLPRTTRVSLTVFDALGREIATLADGIQNPGDFQVRFDGKGVASGVYFYVLRTGEQSITKRLQLVR